MKSLAELFIDSMKADTAKKVAGAVSDTITAVMAIGEKDKEKAQELLQEFDAAMLNVIAVSKKIVKAAGTALPPPAPTEPTMKVVELKVPEGMSPEDYILGLLGGCNNPDCPEHHPKSDPNAN
jgi:hypothetical protein